MTRFYWPIAKLDAEQRMVWGYASTEALDDHGERISRDALAGALDDYMRFANIREMHRESAVGVAREAAVDDKGLYLAARIVDDDAWRKVVEGVYKGFSIGGRVTARDPADRRLITGLRLTEISIVDRPANPEAVFDCWKRAGAADRTPVQVWDCGMSGHRHATKGEALRCIEAGGDSAGSTSEPHLADHADPGYRPDGRPRYPLDSESHIRAAWAFIHRADHAAPYTAEQLAQITARIVAAWQARIDPDGPPALAAAPSGPADGHAAAAAAEDLRKAFGLDLAAGLAKFAGEILPRLDALQRRVEDIAKTPLPPQTAARGLVAVGKREDGGASPAGNEIVAALAQMSEEERTLALIKAAHATPLRPFGR